MAPTRGRLQRPAQAYSDASPRRSTRRGKAPTSDSSVPNVYQDLLEEATPSKAAGVDEDSKPLKKRRIAASRPAEEPDSVAGPSHQSLPTRELIAQFQEEPPPSAPASSHAISDDENGGRRARQTIEVSDDSDSDDSDFEWEDALADNGDNDEEHTENAEGEADAEIGDISITFGGEELKEQDRAKKAKRRGITSADRKRRLDIHKMHVLCLLYHVHRRNAWCNDEKVQAALRKLPSPKMLSNLVPNPEYSQFQASKRFIDGMLALNLMWSKRFSVTALGMRKPQRTDLDAEVPDLSVFQNLDDPMDKQDFCKAATSLHGSQDLGAQLFCALLRGIGVEARLVCSLQCLPFASTAQASTPGKQGTKTVIHLDPFNKQEATTSPVKEKSTNPHRSKRLTRLERVMGERSSKLSSGVAPKQLKKYHTAYPVYWVEAFNQALQKWIPIDPLSTFTVDKAEKLEPPLNYSQNSLAYVIAFEEDHTAKDVTRRYAKAYNAKTRKLRVESTEGGAKWWKGALKPFKRRTPLDRDQLEDGVLARKEAQEGMPKNVQDFKDHPVYVLERHLRHNEVIHPMHQVGKVNVASAMNPKMEPIYRRKDVHVVRSADKWYRLGRDVKDGEQPLKHAKPKKGARGRSVHLETDMDVDDQNEEIGVGLYAPFQTELYVPPPVVNGRVPRNGFGNLDLYVPSMVPPGGVHIRHKLAAKAARLVGVDSADAVTGFSFKGRHGTAIVQGVVVAQEYMEAVEAVIDAMEYAQEEAENSQRSAEALRMWRRFYLGLKIAQRVNAIEIDGEKGPTLNLEEEVEKEDKRIREEQLAGGFFPDEAGGNDFGGGFVPEGNRNDGGFMPESSNTGGGFIPEKGNDEGGGFIPEDNHDEGGGFILENPYEGGGFIPDSHDGERSISKVPANTRSPHLSAQPDEMDEDPNSIEEHREADTMMREPSPIPSHPIPRTAEVSQVNGATEKSGGGFLIPEDEPREDERPTVDTAKPSQPEQTEQKAGSDLTQDLSHASVQGQEDTTEEAEAATEAEPSPPASSPSEAGSLPLEDPDDEDAEPDWLVDVT